MSARTERSADPELSKLQQHLQLLKKEYAKLQGHCADLEKKVALLSAHDISADTFASRLIASVAALYKQNQYRCVVVLEIFYLPCSDIRTKTKTKRYRCFESWDLKIPNVRPVKS